MIIKYFVSALLLIGLTYETIATPSNHDKSQNQKIWMWSAIESLHDDSHGSQLSKTNQHSSSLIIKKNGSAFIELPKRQWLRLKLSKGHLTEQNVGDNKELIERGFVWYSVGNGLFLPATLNKEKPHNEQTPQKHSWLLESSEKDKTLIKIKNPFNKTLSLHLSMGSEHDSLNRVKQAFEPSDKLNSKDKKWYFLSSKSKHIKLNRYQDSEVITMDLKGPGSWKLETRLLYDKQDWQRFIDVPIKLNGKYWNNWRLHPSIDHSNTLHNSQCNVLTSFPETYEFSLPKGNHRLEFTSPQSMFVRLLNMKQNPYLFSRNAAKIKHSTSIVRKMPLSKTPFDRVYNNQMEFDNAILDAFYSGSISQEDMEKYLNHEKNKQKKLNPWLHNSQALKDIIQRYQIWKPLNIANNRNTQNKAWLVPVKAIPLKKGRSRYIRKGNKEEIRLDNLVRINVNGSSELHAPSNKGAYKIRLQFPIYETPYDFKIVDRLGKEKTWLWRPKHLSIENFEIQSGKHLNALINGDKQFTQQALATVSADISLNANEFPIRLSHSSKHAIRYSAFYKEIRHFSLDQNSWNRAIDTLGKTRITTLLTNDQPTKRTQHSLLENKVIQDLKPIKEWLFHNRQLWSSKLSPNTFTTPQLKQETIVNLTRRLTNKGEYKLLTDILKGVAIKDPSPKRRSQAMGWLYEYYSGKNDTANISAYHSWKFKYFPQQHLPILTHWLVQQGQSKLALRLYTLFQSNNRDVAKFYTSVKQNWHHNNKSTPNIHHLWQAILEQDWNQSVHYSDKIKHHSQWQYFIQSMPDHSEQHNPVKWLSWINKSPDSNIKVPIHLIPKQQAGSALLYQAMKDKSFQLATAHPNTPIEYQLIGPVEVQFAFRLQHSDQDRLNSIDDWVEIENNQNKKWLPILNSRASQQLKILPSEIGVPGSIKKLTVSLGPGTHNLKIKAFQNPLMVSAKIYSPALLSNLMDAIQNTDTATQLLSSAKINKKIQSNPPMNAISLLDNVDINQLQSCEENNLLSILGFNVYSDHENWEIPSHSQQWQAPNTLQKIDGQMGAQAIKDVNDLEQYLLAIIWHWPTTPANERAKLLANANHLAQKKSLNPDIRKLINKINRAYGWKKESIVLSSAGNKKIKLYIESDYFNEREQLIFQGKPNKGERLYGHNQLGLMMNFKKSTKLKLNIHQTQLPYQLMPEGKLIVTLNKKTIKTLELPKAKHVINLKIPSGRQQLRIRLLKPSSDHWVYVQANAFISGKWLNMMRPRQSRFQVATHALPLNIHLKQASWLRIDEYQYGQVKQQYQQQKEAGTLILKPASDQTAAMYRVFSLQEKNDTRTLVSFNAHGKPFNQMQVHSHASLLSHLPVSQPDINGTSQYAQHRSSNGIYFQHEARYDLDGNANNQEIESFNELGWRHRKKLNCLSCYWRSDVFGRSHTNGNEDVIGAKVWLIGQLPYSDNWSWRIKQEALFSSYTSEAWRWAGFANLINKHSISESIQNRHYLEFFAQHLSFDINALPQDTDVYSQYKNDHKWGIKIEESLHIRPWLDSYLSGHFRLVSNELDQTLDPDYFQAGLSWSQYWNPLEVSLSYRHRTYLVDNLRSSANHQPTLGINFKLWQQLKSQDLIEYRARVNSDLNNNEYAITFEISWNMTNTMGFSHFMPSESAFHSLKRDAFARRFMASSSTQEAAHEE